MFHLEVRNKNRKRMSDRITQPMVDVMYPPMGAGIMFIKFVRYFQSTGMPNDPENQWDQIAIYKKDDAYKLAHGILRQIEKLSD